VRVFFWLIPFFEGMGWVWPARLEICGWARKRSLAGAEPSSLLARLALLLSALGSKGQDGFPVDGWQVAGERAAEASFGIGESIATEFGWGHRQ
jgi:hypothetical protein